MITLLFLIARILNVHGMAGDGTGNGPVLSQRETFSVHLRFHADAVAELHAVTLPAESHLVGEELSFGCISNKKTSQFFLGEYMADPTTLGRGVGIDCAIRNLRRGNPCSRENKHRNASPNSLLHE